MPRYSYTCEHCTEPFKVKLSYAEVDTAQPICPTCGSSDCKRELSKISLNTGNGSTSLASVGSSCNSGASGFR